MADWFIYVIAFDDEMHKIGISMDPHRRLQTLCVANTIGAAPLELTYSRPVPEGRARTIESRAHKPLADRRYPRSEYFYCRASIAVAAVDLSLLMEDEVEPKGELLDPNSPTRKLMRKRYDKPGRPPKFKMAPEQEDMLRGLWKDPKRFPRDFVRDKAEEYAGQRVSDATLKRMFGSRGSN